ncbi:MAG: WD40 repeat domain-containing protein [Planctomycetota bacterium]
MFRLLQRENEPTRILSGLEDGRLTVWQVESDPYQRISRGDHRGCHAVAISPDNRTLAYAGGVEGGPGTILLPVDGTERIELKGHTEMVTAIAFSCDGRSLATSSFDGTVAIWDPVDGSMLHRFTDHTGRVSTVAFSPDSNTLASAGDGGMILVRDLSSGSVRTLDAQAERVPSVAFHPDGRRLASAGTDGAVRLWDFTTGELLSTFIPDGKIMRAVCFSPDGAILASGGDGNTIVLIDLATGRHEPLRAHPAAVCALAFEPEGRVLLSGDRFGEVMLWDMRERRQIAALPKHPELMMSIAVSPDGMSIATGSAGSDPEVRLWNLDAYRSHIAGNLEHHARRITEALGHEPPNLEAMRDWAAQ